MKIFVNFSVLFFLSTLFTQAQSSFCAGWKEGYKEGYCYEDYGCVSPVPPICPVPNVDENNFKGGYNRGFIAGSNAKAKLTKSNHTGGAYGQLQPIKSDNINQQIQNFVRRENQLKAEIQAKRNQSLPFFQDAVRKASIAFENRDYRECIKLYNNSKDLGWYDNKFELATGVSYAKLWKQENIKEYFKMAKKLMKLSKKHGNPYASNLLREIKEQEKNINK